MRGAEPLPFQDMTFSNAGALRDPRIRGVHHRGQLSIREHVGRQITVHGGDCRAWLCAFLFRCFDARCLAHDPPLLWNPCGYHEPAEDGSAPGVAAPWRVIDARTARAPRALGVSPLRSMIASSRAKAPSWRRRSGESWSKGRSPAASRSGVQSLWRNSGTTFSPSTRLARITVLMLVMRRNKAASQRGTRYAATIGTWASANSKVTVPEAASAA